MAGDPRSPGLPQAGPAAHASDGAGGDRPAPDTSKAATEHKIYPYLLSGIVIERVNQVWCSEVTYIPMAKGFLYLVVVMDWASRAVLAWRLSNTLGADFCVEALEARSPDTAGPRSSTPTRAVSSAAPISPAG
jgi:transposase InsO family protein